MSPLDYDPRGKQVLLDVLQDAFQRGPREKLLYVPAVIPDHSRPDYLATIDADPESATYSQV